MPMKSTANSQSPWNNFYGPNLGYMNELYERYRNDPDSVDPEMRELFVQWGSPPSFSSQGVSNGIAPSEGLTQEDQREMINKAVEAGRLVRNIRTFGHLSAKIDPIEDTPKQHNLFDLEEYGLTEQDLASIPAEIVWKDAHQDVRSAKEAVERLREIYTKSLGFEFDHVHNIDERKWLLGKVESGELQRSLPKEKRLELLRRLTEVEHFEQFLQRTFVGQKRFSIEGVDALVPMLDEIVLQAIQDGAKDVMIGMAHRGRLNVLAHVLGKPYEAIFSEFHRAPNKDLVPSEGSTGINFGWTGDVKYHLGANRSLTKGESVARITLANNPSHLEFVNPVVAGLTRAAQEDRSTSGYPNQDIKKALAIYVHGDAAFPGEGVVAEALNLSQLRGYQTGGSIHIIANNRIGFTTTSTDSRSTLYASDLAKGFEIPIVHVNADDIEACIAAIQLACAYRARFQKDFLIDLIGYRRMGHNEMDDPEVTQPLMYQKIKQHPTLRTHYANRLQSETIVSSEQSKEMVEEVDKGLQQAYKKMVDENIEPIVHYEPVNGMDKIETFVESEKLKKINEDLLKYPEGFTVYPKLDRILKRRKDAFTEGGRIDWSLAETMAYATILADGIPIRLTGQDTERGTFAHRNLVLHDPKTGEAYSPLHTFSDAKASFAIHNSPLTEAAVLGFEYGYDVFAPESLVIWEAQFGDFANAGQVIIDQFISAGRAKWGENSELVLLLPHGYEGQGPEHSSARLERFLQLGAENNWAVVNLTSAAQYFHLLRLQAARIVKEAWRPLIVMAPKSLLRNQRVASSPTEFSEGKFLPVLEQPNTGQKQDLVERLILCSGKVAIDLETELESHEEITEKIHIIRVEQLYPFPKKELEPILKKYKNAKEIVWLQEEPKNMGSWMYIEPKLRDIAPNNIPVKYVGRPDRSSPAEGMSEIHNIEQHRILTEALSMSVSHEKQRSYEGSK